MALFSDSNDPNNLGMFSKAGRYTSEKYIIFQKKDEIIHNQRKFLKVTALPHLKMDFEGKDHLKAIQEEEIQKSKPQTTTKKSPEFEPFSQQLARDEYYKVKKDKHQPPPCGFYNPKYNHVEKLTPTLFKYDQEKTKEKFYSTMTDFNVEEASRPLPRKALKKLIGPASFHLQTSRKSGINVANNPHESRFNFFEVPQTSTKNKKVKNVSMEKTLPRDTKFLFKSLEYSPDYDPNFEFGKKSLGSPGAKFESVTARKSLAFQSPSFNQDFFNNEKKESLNFNKTQTTFFDNTGSRESHPSSPLPSFMQKTMNSRFAIDMVRQKTLEINKFGDGRLHKVYSSLSPTIFRTTF